MRSIRRRTTRGRRASTRKSIADPNSTPTRTWCTPTSSWATATTTSTSRPARARPRTTRCLTKAIENYKLAAEKETDPKMKKLALDYLVAAYGPDKLDDPTQAEPIVQQMIQLDPSDTTNYFVLAKIYEDAGKIEQAEAMLMKAKEVKPKEPRSTSSSRASTSARASSTKLIDAVQQRADARAEQPRGALRHRHLLLGRGVSQHPPERGPEAGIRREGPRVGREGAAAEAGLRRGDRLQGSAAESSGRHGKGRRPAEGALNEATQLQEKAAALKKKQARRTRRTEPAASS